MQFSEDIQSIHGWPGSEIKYSRLTGTMWDLRTEIKHEPDIGTEFPLRLRIVIHIEQN